jgi:hypothetical protein
MPNIELKPCPFCGGKAYIKLKGKSHGEHFGATYEVGCDECQYSFNEESRWYICQGQIMTDKDGYTDCVRRWNRRSSDE